MNVLEERRQAVTRIRAREKPREYVTAARENGREVRMQTGGGPGEFAEPQDLGQWLDDRIVRTPPLAGAAGEVLCTVAAGARRDGKTALAALAGARHLSEWEQYRLYVILRSWAAFPFPPADRLLKVLFREWARLGLAAEQPDEGEQIPVRTLNQADLDATEALHRKARGW
jgi:hypothetical protein